VVLDPAKLVGHKSEMMKGKASYHDFNKLACQVVKPGGLFLTCSCSGLIDEAHFLDIVFAAAKEVKKELKVLKLTGADVDHPFTSAYPEGRYLKAAFIQVMN
jgi:23S rRNA (cytosine1962-C5)-methyltransferase